ncbi:hypothetical protein RFI_22631 [Reticulomyxa filosa]|uniref:Uncharacterized protein n=1 Tax=Reticulomyxa filosa TaxID=46433 RepID=X6MM55_RETFI|nr:hypothetical protein RFI_22631 [Reticulomyxa filosa]|eukprot:ETO14736.1 hypothetical protein RFI_22631 [Reticulomyxa filosa]
MIETSSSNQNKHNKLDHGSTFNHKSTDIDVPNFPFHTQSEHSVLLNIKLKIVEGSPDSMRGDTREDSVMQSPMVLPAPHPGLTNYVPFNNTPNVVPGLFGNSPLAFAPPLSSTLFPGDIESMGQASAFDNKGPVPFPFTRRESTSQSQTESENRDEHIQPPQILPGRKPPISFFEPFQVLGSSKSVPDLPSPDNGVYLNDTLPSQNQIPPIHGRPNADPKKKLPPVQRILPVSAIAIPENKTANYRPSDEHGNTYSDQYMNSSGNHTNINAPNWKTSFRTNFAGLDRSLEPSDHDHTDSRTHTNSLLQQPMTLSARPPPKQPPSLANESFHPQGDSSLLTQDLTSRELTETGHRDAADMLVQPVEDEENEIKSHIASL